MLIDGDNAQYKLLEKMLIETSKYGTVIIRRIYGDWTNTTLNGWKKLLHEHAFQPMQQFQNTVGKNSTDSALIIDAMDLLHEGIADCFCIVSSDSDFTRLATRIRSSGSMMIGIGKKMTPSPFVAACDVFVYTENLDVEPEIESHTENPPIALPRNEANGPAIQTPKALPLLKKAFEISVQENGLATLSSLGHKLRQINPSFDTRTYGVDKLSTLLKEYPKVFEIDETMVYVRLVEPPALKKK
jgi:uncharacterized LabA/DUF88 family protein